MYAYLEKELYDILTFNIHNPNAPDFKLKTKRTEELGKELYDGGTDAIDNMSYPIEFRRKDEISRMLSIPFMVKQHISRMKY